MDLYRVIEITNKEPLKIGSGGSKSGQIEPSKDYIPGSTIRGAFINKFIRFGIFNEQTSKRILSQVDFYNAYPFLAGSLFFPTPYHLRVDKHDWRARSIQGFPSLVAISNLLNDEDKA